MEKGTCIKYISVDEVSTMFHTTAPIIKAAILNGTLPIGFVADDDRDRIIIVKQRLDAWLNASDLILSK